MVATGAVLQTENAVVGNKLERDQIEKLPAAGRNLSAVTLYTAGATSTESRASSTACAAAAARRSTASAAGQQLHGRRHRLERGDQQRHHLPAESRRRGTGQRRDEQLLGRARQRRRRRRQHGDQVGDEPVPRERVLLLARQQAGGDAVGHQPRRRHASRSSRATSSAARSAARSCATSCSSSANYQGGRQETPPADSFATVVPDAWRQGDLSSLLARNIIIRDPLTGQPFPNNQIPVSRFSPFARNLFADESLYPRPNVVASAQRLPRRTTAASTASKQDVDQFDVKIDWNASSRDKLYVRYSRQAGESPAPRQTVMPLSFASASDNPFWGMAANWNRIFGTTRGQRPARRVQRHLEHQRSARPARPRQAEQPARHRRRPAHPRA